MVSPPDKKDDIDHKTFTQILLKVESMIPLILEYKKDHDKVILLLAGDKFTNPKTPSLIEAVDKLKEQIETKADKAGMESVFNVQNKEIKNLMEASEAIPEIKKDIADLKKDMNEIKSIPGGIFRWLLALSLTVTGLIGTFLIQLFWYYFKTS